MSQTYANVVDGKVINTIISDNFESIAEMLGAENIVPVTETTGNPEVNGIWDGNIFHSATESVSIRPEILQHLTELGLDEQGNPVEPTV